MVRGTVQGNSLSPLWFNIAQDFVLKQFYKEITDKVKLISFHDDHYLLGPIEDVLPAFDKLIQKLKIVGLEVNISKSQIFSFGNIDKAFHQKINEKKLKLATIDEGILVVGTPIGSDKFMMKFMDNKIKELENKMKKLSDHFRFPNLIYSSRVQTLYTLLRLCIPQSIIYFLRTIPPYINDKYTKQLDLFMYNFLIKILDVEEIIETQQIIEEVTLRVFTNIKRGGFGIINTHDLINSAYVGSLSLVTESIVQIYPELKEDTGWLDNYEIAVRSFDKLQFNTSTLQIQEIMKSKQFKIQHKLTEAINKENQRKLELMFQRRFKNRGDYNTKVLKIQNLNNSEMITSTWLLGIPSFKFQKLEDREFRNSFLIRNMVDFTKDKNCICGIKLDFFGNHSLHCLDKTNGIQSKLRSRSHAIFKYRLIEILRNYFITHSTNFRILDEYKEPLINKFFIMNENISQKDEEKEYRGDFGIENIKNGEIEIVDVTIAAPSAQCYAKCNAQVGDAANKTETIKRRKYDKIISKDSPQQCNLFIFAIENNGGLARNAIQFCKRLANLSEDPTHSLHQLYAEINVTIQKIRSDQMFDIDKLYSTNIIYDHVVVE